MDITYVFFRTCPHFLSGLGNLCERHVCNTVVSFVKGGAGRIVFSLWAHRFYIHSCNMQLYISKAVDSFVTTLFHVTEYTICVHGSIYGLADYVSATRYKLEVCVRRCDDVVVGNGGRFEKEVVCHKLNVKIKIRLYIFRTTIVTLYMKESVVLNVL